jgi:hypothetical protein
MCNCNDPSCTLPEGRCYLCGQPTPKANSAAWPREEFTVCLACKRSARAALSRLRKRLGAGVCSKSCAGLGLSNEIPFGPAEVQTCDACAVFMDDREAAMILAAELGCRPTHPSGY